MGSEVVVVWIGVVVGVGIIVVVGRAVVGVTVVVGITIDSLSMVFSMEGGGKRGFLPTNDMSVSGSSKVLSATNVLSVFVSPAIVLSVSDSSTPKFCLEESDSLRDSKLNFPSGDFSRLSD